MRKVGTQAVAHYFVMVGGVVNEGGASLLRTAAKMPARHSRGPRSSDRALPSGARRRRDRDGVLRAYRAAPRQATARGPRDDDLRIGGAAGLRGSGRGDGVPPGDPGRRVQRLIRMLGFLRTGDAGLQAAHV